MALRPVPIQPIWLYDATVGFGRFSVIVFRAGRDVWNRKWTSTRAVINKPGAHCRHMEKVETTAVRTESSRCPGKPHRIDTDSHLLL